MLPDGIHESHNCVFIAGAGASVPCGLPAMKQFLEVARRRFFEISSEEIDPFLGKCFEDLLLFYEKCKRSSWSLNRDWDNIEEIYTQADLRRLAGLPDSKRLCDRIAWTLWDIYRRCNDSGIGRFREICQRVSAGGMMPAVITTNYDLTFEAAIRFRQTDPAFFYPGFSYPDIHDNTQLSLTSIDPADELKIPNGRVPIIKLHGSANWFNIGGRQRVSLNAVGKDAHGVTAVNDTNLTRTSLRDWLEKALAKKSVDYRKNRSNQLRFVDLFQPKCDTSGSVVCHGLVCFQR